MKKLTPEEKIQRTQSVASLERSRKVLVSLATALREHSCRNDILEAVKWLALAEQKVAQDTDLILEGGTWKKVGG